MTQTQRLLNYLKEGNPMPMLMANEMLNITNVRTTVSVLRKQGHTIILKEGAYIYKPGNAADEVFEETPDPVLGSLWNILDMTAFSALCGHGATYLLEVIIYGKRFSRYSYISRAWVTRHIKALQGIFNPGAPYYVRITHIDYKEQRIAA